MTTFRRMLGGLTLLIVLAGGGVLAGEGAAVDPMPGPKPRDYVPFSMSAMDGKLTLSATTARFPQREGHLELAEAGTMPESKDLVEMSGATVYQVTNVDDYFARNRNRAGFCKQPVRWLTVKKVSLRPNQPTRLVSVCQLILEDWRQFKASAIPSPMCSCDTFSLAEGQ